MICGRLGNATKFVENECVFHFTYDSGVSDLDSLELMTFHKEQ
jgi:hypothetical protein